MIAFRDLPSWCFFDSDCLAAWLGSVANQYGARIRILEYHFVNDEEIQKINSKYLSHDYATDVVTFGYSEGKTVSGEIYIGIEMVSSNARLLGVREGDELDRVMAHGLLHLIGFNDETDEQKIMMREEEEKCLLLRPKIMINK